MQISVHTDMKSKKIYSNEELQNQSIRGQITFGIQLQTFAWNSNTKNFNLKPDPQMKQTHSNQRCNFIHQHYEVRE